MVIRRAGKASPEAITSRADPLANRVVGEADDGESGHARATCTWTSTGLTSMPSNVPW